MSSAFADEIPSLQTVLYFGPTEVDGAVSVDRAVADAGRRAPRRGGRLRRRTSGRSQRLHHDLLDVGHREPSEGGAAGALRVAGDELGHGVLAEPDPRFPDPQPVPDGQHGRASTACSCPGCAPVACWSSTSRSTCRSSCGRSRRRGSPTPWRPPALLALLLQREELLAGADISTLAPDRIRLGAAAGVDGPRLVRPLRRVDHQLLRLQRGHQPDDRRQADDRPGAAGPVLPALWRRPEVEFPCGATHVGEADRSRRPATRSPSRGSPGELYLKGPSLFAGYLDGANLPSPFDDEGYLKTGDMFVIDGPNQEFLRYVDRAKDLIIRGGMNIAPAELETMIAIASRTSPRWRWSATPTRSSARRSAPWSFPSPAGPSPCPTSSSTSPTRTSRRTSCRNARGPRGAPPQPGRQDPQAVAA